MKTLQDYLKKQLENPEFKKEYENTKLEMNKIRKTIEENKKIKNNN